MDEAFVPLADLVPGLLPRLPDIYASYDEDSVVRTRVVGYDVTSPLELDVVVRTDGTIELGGAPPLYHLDTSTRPSLHGLRVLAVLDEEDETR